MAWRSHGTSNGALIDSMLRNSVLRPGRVERALRTLDRANYVKDVKYAYLDRPQPIGHGVTISAPHMHAACLQLLEPHLQPGMRGLDCGSGSGYLTAAMMSMVTEGGGTGAVFGIEYISPLVPWSVQNLEADGKREWLNQPEAFDIKAGDGSKGWAERGPFNAIHVGAAAPVVPKALVEQLAAPGRLVVPVGGENEDQYLMVVDKDKEGRVTSRREFGVRYVPFYMDRRDSYEVGAN